MRLKQELFKIAQNPKDAAESLLLTKRRLLILIEGGALGRRTNRKRKINNVLNYVRAEQTRRFENLRVLLSANVERE